MRDDASGVERGAEWAGLAPGAAVYLAHRGYGRIALASLFKVEVDTISAWLDGWERAGGCGLGDAPCSGRPTIDTPAEAAELCRFLEAEPRPLKRAQAGLARVIGKRASRRTVHRTAKKSLPLEAVSVTGQRLT